MNNRFAEMDKYEKEYVGLDEGEEDLEAKNRMLALAGMHNSVFAASGIHGFFIPCTED